MTETTRCPRCHAAVPPDAPGGICPKCLLEKGMESTVGYPAATASALDVGQRFGSYHIVRLLGRGGMGAVYEARHTESGRLVALKVLNHKLPLPEQRQRFLREGRLAASVNHPNIVYIFGTEEIEDSPVIAMELGGGGTLEDRVKRDGPLPIGEAVDIVLDIVAGLQAAEAAGVLHRDIKPANCFFGSDGTVKIGDFGLSISTALRAETNLTQSGVFLGTPLFSSPEQLRGDELDVRSDIYSIGVTLYYMLTGKMPFAAKQMVQLLATVLDRPAPSPRESRPDVPSGLAKIIVRCMAKQKSQRFDSYAELRQALMPYRSEAPTPATLGFRLLASMIDTAVLIIMAALLPLVWFRDMATWQSHFDAIWPFGPQRTLALTWLSGFGGLVHLSYFTLLEGIWGASIGKAVCRLRVVGPDREAPGIVRALLRTLLFVSFDWLPWWMIYAVNAELAVRVFAGNMMSTLDFSVFLICGLLLFAPLVSMRRRNGFAGLHELGSGTRVIGVPAVSARPALSGQDQPLPDAEDTFRVGPYDVLGPLEAGAEHGLLLAYDARLLRKVWLRKCPGDKPPLPAKLREITRIGRLRWLNGHRGEDESWDAWEAPAGKPFLTLIEQPQPWNAVRYWLLDLARELEESGRDGTTPDRVDLDRIWITADGRAKLLDFPAPGLDHRADETDQSRPDGECADGSTANVGLFLKRTAIAALEGRLLSKEEAAESDLSCRLPLAARLFLNDLGRDDTPRWPAAQLDLFTRKPAAVTKRQRIGLLAACLLIPVLMAAVASMYRATEKEFLKEYPEVGMLSGYVSYYQMLLNEGDAAETAELRNAIEIVTVDRFRETINQSDIWSHPAAESLVDARGQELLQRFVENHPEPAPAEVATAARLLEPQREQISILSFHADEYLYSGPLPAFILMLVIAFVIIFAVIPGFLSTLLMGESLLLRFMEIAVVDRAGARASRWRVFWRSVALWTITLLGLGILFGIVTWGSSRFGLLLVTYGIVTMFTSERGLHDMLVGTWLVPR